MNNLQPPKLEHPKLRSLSEADRIERDVIYHVQNKAEYHEKLKEPYCVNYDGRVFSSTDTRDLVVQIMRECHGVTLDDAVHVHEYRRVPKGERTDRLTFCCSKYACECGEWYYM